MVTIGLHIDVKKMLEKGKSSFFIPMEGEGHGFKNPESKKIVMDKIQWFFTSLLSKFPA